MTSTATNELKECREASFSAPLSVDHPELTFMGQPAAIPASGIADPSERHEAPVSDPTVRSYRWLDAQFAGSLGSTQEKPMGSVKAVQANTELAGETVEVAS